MPDIVTLGETMVSFVPHRSGCLRYVRDYEMQVSGAESNLAIDVAKLGRSSGWISRLGNDEFGYFIRNFIRAEGVDTSRVQFTLENKTGVMFKQINNNRETSVDYYRADSAATTMNNEMIDFEYLKNSKIVHLTGITPLLSVSCKSLVETIVSFAREHQILISFDPNIRKKLWKDKDHSPLMKSILSKSTIVLLGLDEAKVLFGTDNVDEIVDNIFSSGTVEYIGLKNSSKGAIVASRNERHKIPPFPCSAVDPVGAGDAFNAAFLCGVLEGKNLKTCGEMGAIAGALTTETIGDTEGMPTKEILSGIMESQSMVYR